MFISVGFDKDVYRKLFSTIDENIESFGKNILLIGCDCGIDACYLGLLLPDSKILAIDTCKEAIANAKELANRYEITNINFEQKNLYELKNEKFDSIVMVRMFGELFDRKIKNYFYMRLEERIGLINNDVNLIVTHISSLLNDKGSIYWLDRMKNEFTYTVSKSLKENKVEDINYKMYEIEECGELEDYTLIKAIKQPSDEDFHNKWCNEELNFFNNGKCYKCNAAAKIYDYCTSGNLIYGFEAYSDSYMIYKLAMYENKNNKDVNIVWYGNNEIILDAYPIKDKKEILYGMKMKEKEFRKILQIKRLKLVV